MNLKLYFAEEGQNAEEMAAQETTYYHRKSRVCRTGQSQRVGLLRGLEGWRCGNQRRHC